MLTYDTLKNWYDLFSPYIQSRSRKRIFLVNIFSKYGSLFNFLKLLLKILSPRKLLLSLFTIYARILLYYSVLTEPTISKF